VRLALALLFVASAAGAQPFEARPFEDRTFLDGLGSVTNATGVAVADFDGDGDLDVYVVVPAAYDAAQAVTWNRLFARTPTGYVDVTREAGVAGVGGGAVVNASRQGQKVGAAWGDYDNDGWPDLYLTHSGPNQLLHNNRNGTFTDLTARAGVAGGPAQFSTSALWFDYDADGDLDLYVGVWDDNGAGASDRTNRLYENLGESRFRDVTAASGLVDSGQTYSAVALDADGDGALDVYTANDFGPNRLWLGDGAGQFHLAADSLGLADAYHGMGLAVGDPNADGRFDLYLTNISATAATDEAHRLFARTEAGLYEDVAADAGVAVAGWGWGAAFFDLENDGDEDLYVGTGYFDSDTPNALFENRSDSGAFRFDEVASALGVARRDAARGVVAFDADGDGRQDVLVAHFSRRLTLYHNASVAGAWLAVDVEGTTANRDGLGAVVEVEAGGRRFVRLHHGAGLFGQSLAPVHVGLGGATVVDRVTVRWPGGGEDIAEGLAVDQTVRIRQGAGLVEGRAVATEDAAPAVLRLRVAPNPASGPVTLRVESPQPAELDVTVSDVLGRVVHRVRQPVGAGVMEAVWEMPDRLAAGVYVVRVASAAGVASATVTVVR